MYTVALPIFLHIWQCFSPACSSAILDRKWSKLAEFIDNDDLRRLGDSIIYEHFSFVERNQLFKEKLSLQTLHSSKCVKSRGLLVTLSQYHNLWTKMIQNESHFPCEHKHFYMSVIHNTTQHNATSLGNNSATFILLLLSLKTSESLQIEQKTKHCC